MSNTLTLATLPPEDEIARLNISIRDHVSHYLNADGDGCPIDICFNAPDPARPPASPTVYLFLYLIHEDLTVRHAEGRVFQPATGHYAPGYANVRCCYIATYWDSQSGAADSPAAAFDNQAVLAINRVASALIGMREREEFASNSVKILEPEGLNTLGNFWQALGNKPRLMLNFAVTQPISLAQEDQETVPVLTSIESRLRQADGDTFPRLEAQLLADLQQALGNGAQARDLLARVVLAVATLPFAGGSEPPKVAVTVSGFAFIQSEACLTSTIDAWQDKIVNIGKQSFTLAEIQSGITFISPLPAS